MTNSAVLSGCKQLVCIGTITHEQQATYDLHDSTRLYNGSLMLAIDILVVSNVFLSMQTLERNYSAHFKR